MSTAPVPFDLCGDLPTGITLLEASAGTGKTHAIATLALRYVAERGVPLDRLLIVTFTRMATGELRERVRERLVSAGAALDGALGEDPVSGDPVLEMLATGERAQVMLRRDRIRAAVAGFDAATIATTHGFCRRVLEGLGIAGDTGRDAVFEEDVDDLVQEVVDDLYVRRFHARGDVQLNRALAVDIGRAAVGNPATPLEPRKADPEDMPAMRRRLAQAVRDEFELRKRRLGVLTYDDLLTRLHAVITSPAGEACRARLAERYEVALIDEFQDTDPLQWDIVRCGFRGRTVILIGDPKQAIYAFRGADVFTYLEAARVAGTRHSLAVNWRSHQPLVSALDALLDGAQLGHPGIRCLPVTAAPGHQGPGIRGARSDAALRVRVARRDAGLFPLTPKGFAKKKPACVAVAVDLADQVVGLLRSGASVAVRDGEEAVRPGHVAVLVPTNNLAALVRDTLTAAGVPAVIAGAGSVFATRAADEWLRLLRALERPADQRRAASAALTAFLGWPPARLAGAGDDEREALHATLHSWRRVLADRGVAALVETIMRGERLAERVLSEREGERHLTDIRHVGALLHEEANAGHLGLPAMGAWLAERLAEADREIGEDRSRRLDSDSEAVQVLTVHRAKGLEFPVVCLPFAWDNSWIPGEGEAVPLLHDPARGGERVIDVGGPDGPGFERRYARYVDEQRGEELRLAYVGLTRARCQVILWWAGSWDGRHSGLARLLVDRAPDGSIPAEAPWRVADDDVVEDLFAQVGRKAPGCVDVERVGPPGWLRFDAPPAPVRVLEGARLARDVDRAWGRHSYSAIAERAHEQGVASEPENAGRTDEPASARSPGRGDVTLPLGALPAGTWFGSLVHGALERADFAAPDLEAELREVVAAETAWSGGDAGLIPPLAAGLAAALCTPLGPGLDGIRLADLARDDRLDELGFELPLAGGDEPSGRLVVGDLARLLAEHLPHGDPISGYPERLLAAGMDRTLCGYMTGSIDLVLRLRPRADGPARLALVDYKTNMLGWPGQTTADRYHPDALAVEMQRSDYVLQAFIYVVALHRYLRWRIPGYDPVVHLGGAHYLFLRGLAGPGSPVTTDGRAYGVFSWTPPAALVVAASDLFDRGAAPA